MTVFFRCESISRSMLISNVTLFEIFLGASLHNFLIFSQNTLDSYISRSLAIVISWLLSAFFAAIASLKS